MATTTQKISGVIGAAMLGAAAAPEVQAVVPKNWNAQEALAARNALDITRLSVPAPKPFIYKGPYPCIEQSIEATRAAIAPGIRLSQIRNPGDVSAKDLLNGDIERVRAKFIGKIPTIFDAQGKDEINSAMLARKIAAPTDVTRVTGGSANAVVTKIENAQKGTAAFGFGLVVLAAGVLAHSTKIRTMGTGLITGGFAAAGTGNLLLGFACAGLGIALKLNAVRIADYVKNALPRHEPHTGAQMSPAQTPH